VNKKKRILIIDDEESIRDGCHQILSRDGYHVESTGNALEGLEMALGDTYDIILLDIKMPRIGGLDILRKLKRETNVAAKIIMITGYGTIKLAVEAMQSGACNFLTKPYSAGELHKAIENAIRENGSWELDQATALIGNSNYMKELKDSIRRIAQTDSSVLITGESGTGKELVARTIHNWSKRAQKSFIAVDCVSLVDTLMESELFGHIKGAFSGASESREGRFQMADGGTLFLDEIANISLTTQAKLLRFIQEREIPKVGKSTPEKVDVRLVTATNKDIRSEIAAAKFREDLFYRITVVPLDIKPLREHKADIPLIAQFYLDFYREKCESRVKRFSEEAKKSLLTYLWPGNIRELRNTIERLCVLGDHEEVSVSDIFYYGQRETTTTLAADSFGRVTLVDVERKHIEKALLYFHFQINKTANFLGIDRKTLRTKIRNYGIKMEESEK
jgi:DNA-binding NtrC family response regulator